MKKFKWGAMLLMLLLATAANAVPAKRGLKKVLTLTDGTTVSAQLVGDEHGHYWLGADGKAYRQQSGTTYYVVADRQAIEQKASARRTKANAKRMKRLPRHATPKPTARSIHSTAVMWVQT